MIKDGGNSSSGDKKKAARILVVDDDDSFRHMIRDVLQQTGFECEVASSGDEALRVLTTSHVDVVIADIHMPGMSGIELTKQVKDRYNADVIVLTGFVEDFRYEQIVEIGASDFIQKPVGIDELLIRIKRVVRERTLLSQRDRAETDLQQSLEMLQRALEGIIHTVAVTVETRDPYTAGHQKRVASLACEIARQMGLGEHVIDGIRMAGVIHDHGKISVPAEILSKPGSLTRLEFGIIQTHPQVGYDILKKIEFPWPVDRMILQHHERTDGSGYPQGLKKDQILLEARIISVADVIEAMAYHRPYRPALGIDEALNEIRKNSGVIYDREVVDACLAIFEKGRFEFE
jgi:putative two-component system response regulator